MSYELTVALIFYAIVIILIYLNRKKFDIQGKIIALYRMKLGLKAMDRIAARFPRFVHVFGILGIFFGAVGMILIIVMLLFGVYTVFFVPGAPPSVAPVLPGIPIPGSPITIPLFTGIICIFLVAAIHEFSHGVVARRYNYTVKNTGIVFFGPIVGAFVEPDEKALEKAPLFHKLSIFAAGSFSNIILGTAAIIVIFFVLNPLNVNILDTEGINVLGVQKDFPAEQAGLTKDEIITAVNGQSISSRSEFSDIMKDVQADQSISITTKTNTYEIIATQHPNGEGGYIGATLENVVGFKPEFAKYKILEAIYFWFYQFMQYLWIISIGIGLFNLLPLGPIDGGRMLLAFLQRYTNANFAKKTWTHISIFLLFILALNFIPFIKSIFGLII